jgi:hypothetical protein
VTSPGTRAVTAGDRATPPDEALPLDPDHPDGLRPVLIPVSTGHAAREVTLTLRDTDSQVLGTMTFDPAGPIGG